MRSINTGNYRLCRQQVGIGGTREILSQHTSDTEAITSLERTKLEAGWEYYCEKEVIYQGTQFDQNRNPINSAPTWIRI